MNLIDRINEAIKKVSVEKAYDKVTYADIAREADIHWTTVKRNIGSKENIRIKILEYQAASNESFKDTRTKIIDSAEEVFTQLGYDGATLDQVAEHANMTKGAVYWHFTSKSELFLALIDRSLKQLLYHLPQQSKDVFYSYNPQEALSNLLQSQFMSCEHDQGQRPTLFFEFISKRRDEEIHKKLHQSFSQLFNGTTEIIQQMQQQKRLNDDLDPHKLAVTLHAIMNGMILMWLVSPESVPLRSIGEEVAKIVWRGIEYTK
ncbi:TetR/AcrR family transcriptional regulator [Cytobacillus sp. Hm23]